MRILLTNDDGIHAPGLALLEQVAASLSDEEAKKHFPQGFTTEKPYLRWVDHLEWT